MWRNFSTWQSVIWKNFSPRQICSPQAPLVVLVTNIRYGNMGHKVIFVKRFYDSLKCPGSLEFVRVIQKVSWLSKVFFRYQLDSRSIMNSQVVLKYFCFWNCFKSKNNNSMESLDCWYRRGGVIHIFWAISKHNCFFICILRILRQLMRWRMQMMRGIGSFNFSSLDNFELMLKPWIPNEPSVKGNLGNLKSRLLCANVTKNSTPLKSENQDIENYYFTCGNLKFRPHHSLLCKHLAGHFQAISIFILSEKAAHRFSVPERALINE